MLVSLLKHSRHAGAKQLFVLERSLTAAEGAGRRQAGSLSLGGVKSCLLVARLDVGELQHTIDCVSQLSLHNHLRAPNSMAHSMRIYRILTGVRTA